VLCCVFVFYFVTLIGVAWLVYENIVFVGCIWLCVLVGWGVLFSWFSFRDLLNSFGGLHVSCVIGHLLSCFILVWC